MSVVVKQGVTPDASIYVFSYKVAIAIDESLVSNLTPSLDAFNLLRSFLVDDLTQQLRRDFNETLRKVIPEDDDTLTDEG